MDINRLISGFLGGGAGDGAGGGMAGGMGGVAETARAALSGGATSGMGGGLAGGALAGGAMALLLGTKKGRKVGGTALKYGGMAAVGGLAYMAYRNYRASQSGGAAQSQAPQAPTTPTPVQAIPTPPADSGFDPASAQDAQGRDLRLSLVQAMISAAKADGHIDGDEHARIAAQIDTMDLAGDEKAFLFDCMRADSDPIAIATLARDEAQSAEVYLASLLVIDTDTPEERRYMERLGDALRLPGPLRLELENHVAAAKAEDGVA